MTYITKPEMESMCKALRSQGLTWNQVNFAVSLFRNHRAAAVAPAQAHPISEEALRAAFEDWMSDGGKWPRAIERNVGGGYHLLQAHSSWTAWRACAEALAAAPAAQPAAALTADEKRQRAIARTAEKLKQDHAADQQRHAEFISRGICPECEGDGQQGGQFCGGYWTCETCGGTGKAASDLPAQESES